RGNHTPGVFLRARRVRDVALSTAARAQHAPAAAPASPLRSSKRSLRPSHMQLHREHASVPRSHPRAAASSRQGAGSHLTPPPNTSPQQGPVHVSVTYVTSLWPPPRSAPEGRISSFGQLHVTY